MLNLSIVGYNPSEQRMVFMGIKKVDSDILCFCLRRYSGWIVTQLKLYYYFIRYKDCCTERETNIASVAVYYLRIHTLVLYINTPNQLNLI